MIKIILGILIALILCAVGNAADDNYIIPSDRPRVSYQAFTNLADTTRLTQFPRLDGDIEGSPPVTSQPHFLTHTDRSVSDTRMRNDNNGETALRACCRNWCGWWLIACYLCSKVVDDSSGD